MDLKKLKEESTIKIQELAKELDEMGIKTVIIVAFAEDSTHSVFLNATGGEIMSAINTLGEKMNMKFLAIPEPLFKKLIEEGHLKDLTNLPPDFFAKA